MMHKAFNRKLKKEAMNQGGGGVAKMRPFTLQLLQTLFLKGHSQFFDLSEKSALMDTQILCRSTPAEIMA